MIAVESPVVKVPIRLDESGTIRVSGTRVTLDVLLASYNHGYCAEALHEAYDVIPVVDAHAVIAWYLINKVEVDAYLADGEKEAERIRAEIEAGYTPEQRTRLEALQARSEALRREKSDT
jgi:uncharacterized protein (DUF433 family)